MSKILVVAEMLEGKVRKSTHSAITFAKKAGLPFSILVIGQGAASASAEVTGFGAEKVLTADDASLKDYIGERFAPTVAAVAKSGGFTVVTATASSYASRASPKAPSSASTAPR